MKNATVNKKDSAWLLARACDIRALSLAMRNTPDARAELTKLGRAMIEHKEAKTPLAKALEKHGVDRSPIATIILDNMPGAE